eukprot:3340162-Prymnesium_polylepis.1
MVLPASRHPSSVHSRVRLHPRFLDLRSFPTRHHRSRVAGSQAAASGVQSRHGRACWLLAAVAQRGSEWGGLARLHKASVGHNVRWEGVDAWSTILKRPRENKPAEVSSTCAARSQT